jgi:hypothetical protein
MTSKKILLTATAIAALAVPGAAQARQGADDPAGHVRHSADDVRGAHHSSSATKTRSRVRHHRRGRGADDVAGHVRHGRGNDDGPNHT